MNKLLIVLAMTLALWFVAPLEVAAQNVPSISFDPKHVVLNKSDTKSIDLYFDAINYDVTGIDLIIVYDQEKIEITSIDDLKIFDQKVKEIKEPGKVKLALSNNFGRYVSGKKKFATLNLKTLGENGSTKIYFDFNSGKTNDTNLVSRQAKDILGEVGQLNIEINTNNPKNNESTPTDKARPRNQILGTAASSTTTPTQTVIAKVNDDVLGDSTDAEQELTENSNKFPWLWILMIVSFILLGIGSFILGKGFGKANQKA